MKTAEEIAREVIPKNWFDSKTAHERVIQAAVEAMKAYGRQTLEIAADEALLISGGDDSVWGDTLDRDSILNIVLP